MVSSNARRRGIRLKPEAPAQDPGVSHGPDADALTFTHIKAMVPQVLSKRFSLDEHGILVKQSAAQLSEGRCETVRVHDLAEFGAHLDTFGSGDALTFGTTPGYESARIVTKARIGDAAPPAGTIARSREYFQFHRGPGILMLDYDPEKGTEPLTPAALIALVREVAPPLAAVPLLWRPSASSGICLPGGETLTGIAGQRLYIPVQDAGRIPEGGAALVTLLWAAGHGRYDIGAAGQALERTAADASVWQPERLDFAGAPEVGGGLERRAPPAFIDGDATARLDLRDLIALVDGDVVEAAKAARAAEKAKVQPEARKAREAWVEEHAPGVAKRRGVALDTARGILRQACEGHKLFGDFELVTEGGKVVTVGELLDHPDRWHNTRFSEPLEPTYHNDPRIAWANLRSGRRPYIYSHAHGGRRYALVRPSARLELAVDQKPRILDETLDVLRAQVEVFDSSDGMGLLRVTDDARILPITEDWLGDHLDRTVSYYALRADRQGNVTEAAACAPGWLPKRLRAKVGERRLPRLRSVATMPTLRLDGTIVQEPGYDAGSGMLLLSDTPTLPVIPKAPSVAEVRAALETLWAPFRLFPLVGPIDRGAVLSALLTACIRPQLPAAPGHGFDAPAAGTGKSLLAGAVAALMTGEAPAVTPPVSGTGAGADEEIRKKLFAMLRDGHRVVVWDNQQAPLGSPALDAFLTGATYSDRVLGLSESATLSNSSLFLVTGNNLRLAGDTCRRIVVARLDAEVERPFTRSFDFCPLQTVIARRAALVQAALTILRGWITAGRPRHGTARTASFEDWDDTVRQPICWLAEMDPERWADPVGALLTATDHDPEAGKLGALLHAWHAVCGDSWVTTTELANECEGTVINLAGGNARADLKAAIDEIAGDRGGLNRRILGRWIERNVDKRCDGYRIERSPVVHRGSPRWRARAA